MTDDNNVWREHLVLPSGWGMGRLLSELENLRLEVVSSGGLCPVEFIEQDPRHITVYEVGGFEARRVLSRVADLWLCPTDDGVVIDWVMRDHKTGGPLFVRLLRRLRENMPAPGPLPSRKGRSGQFSREPGGESSVATVVVASVPERGEGDPLAVIPSAKDRDFVRRWNAGEDSESLARSFKLTGAHAVGNKAHELRKVFPALVKTRRNQGNWSEDDEE